MAIDSRRFDEHKPNIRVHAIGFFYFRNQVTKCVQEKEARGVGREPADWGIESTICDQRCLWAGPQMHISHTLSKTSILCTALCSSLYSVCKLKLLFIPRALHLSFYFDITCHAIPVETVSKVTFLVLYENL